MTENSACPKSEESTRCLAKTTRNRRANAHEPAKQQSSGERTQPILPTPYSILKRGSRRVRSPNSAMAEEGWSPLPQFASPAHLHQGQNRPTRSQLLPAPVHILMLVSGGSINNSGINNPTVRTPPQGKRVLLSLHSWGNEA